MEIDPVCKMQIDEKKAKYTFLHNGRLYYFCSAGCSVEFSRYPKDYIQSGTDNHQLKANSNTGENHSV